MKIKLEEVIKILNGLGDEVLPFAVEDARQYLAADTDFDPEGLRSDRSMEVTDAALSFEQADTPLEERAAAVRLVARALVYLALDEVVRGPRAVTRDMNKLDDMGRVKPPRGPKVKK